MFVGEFGFDAGLHVRIRVMDLPGEDQDQSGQVGGCLTARYADCFVCSGKLDQLDTELKVTNAYLLVRWGTAQTGVDKRSRKNESTSMEPLPCWLSSRRGELTNQHKESHS